LRLFGEKYFNGITMRYLAWARNRKK